MSFKPNIITCDSPDELSCVACKKILDIVHAAKRESWPLSIALSGGSTPKMLYTRLHDEQLHLLKEERALRFFFGDERLVPADASDSNYNMARQALLHDIPEELVVPVEVRCVGGEASKDACDDAMKAADAYERQITALLDHKKVKATGTRVPIFDIVLLGLGSDGHTASIFPGSPAENEVQHAVSVGFPSPTMRPKVWRVTLTPTTIIHARYVILLATGGEKKWVMNSIMSDAPTETPVSRFLRNCTGDVTFILDKEIAEDLQR
ncbi:6-phosphogluconolactonase [Trypanosoma rangeli]|uniref:6-phosphogluconolactonase n=1 Tax=Trypanosoma rangeli TaxID=5698 RepID=A0A3R7NAW7_TRYRA|nr:6-phosphogluconolactonase [Trypanosoma rangeli]RNF03449.1 6-phosphogluconolactonase [Trypanosoma rangeli]|eukprot:RNF03449.1 6-phosphogluconolactonase [Trypanosoma rangeli]